MHMKFQISSFYWKHLDHLPQWASLKVNNLLRKMELLPYWVRLWALGLDELCLLSHLREPPQQVRKWKFTMPVIRKGTGKQCTQLLCASGCIVHFLWNFQFGEEAESVKVWYNFSKTEQFQCLELGLKPFYSSELPAYIFHLLNTRISFSSWKPSPFSLCSLGEADPVGLWLRPVQREFCLFGPQWLT